MKTILDFFGTYIYHTQKWMNTYRSSIQQHGFRLLHIGMIFLFILKSMFVFVVTACYVFYKLTGPIGRILKTWMMKSYHNVFRR